MNEREQAYKEYYIYNVENTSLTAGTGAAFTDTTIRTDTDADFELIKRTHVANDGRILAQFKDDAYGRNYQNAALDLRMISGGRVSDITVGAINGDAGGFLPFVLPRPIMLKGGTTYTSSLSDFSGVANSIRLALHGAKIRSGQAPWNQPWRARPAFDYTTGRSTIAANGTATFNVAINIDSHFLIHKITAVNTGPALVTVKDQAVDRQWMNVACHIDNFGGNAHFPNILPAPRFIYKGSVINITVQDLSAASNVVQITFHGEKLFL